MCDICKNFVITGSESHGQHHHKMCPRYKTEKFPYLFYYEDAVDCWIPVPDKLENIISVSDNMDVGEFIEIKFNRVDLTDREYDNLPEN